MNFHTQRAVGIWNKMPDEVVGADTITFKIVEQVHGYERFKGFGPNARMWDLCRLGM